MRPVPGPLLAKRLPLGRVETTPIALQDDRYPDFAIVYEYWEKCRAGRIGPPRRKIDPTELKPVLPRLTIVEFDPASGQFRFRLAGTEMFRLHNMEIAYTPVDEMRPYEYRDLLNRQYAEVVRSGRPNAYEIYFYTHDGMHRHYASLRVPLSEDGAAVSGLLTVDCFGERWADLEPYFDRLYDRTG